MWRFTKCNKCSREYMWFSCPNWCDSITETIKQDNPVIKETKTNNSSSHWLELYTSSYLNHKLHKDLNSIKHEKCCIKVWDKYILHTDIINKFKQDHLHRKVSTRKNLSSEPVRDLML
jgi:hypothetical protein